MMDMSQYFNLLRDRIDGHGSELGLAMHLFGLVVSTRAADVLEIGRFKGYSALGLAGGLRFVDEGWQEPEHHQQRPDIDYGIFEGKQRRRLVSVEPEPRPEAEALLAEAELLPYVELVTAFSNDYQPPREFDLVFIDGDHTERQTIRDFERFYEATREGGLLVIHDMFGYYYPDGSVTRPDGLHVNPVKRAVDKIADTYDVDMLLVDTGYMSHVVIRRP